MRQSTRTLRLVLSTVFSITILSVGATRLTTRAEVVPTAKPTASCNLLLAQALKSLPPGNWTLSITPYYGTGWDSIPVDVSSVTTDATRGLSVDSVLLRNLSQQKVTAIKFRWYLRGKQQTSAIQQGETPLLDVNIPAEGQQRLSYGVASFSEIARTLAKDGRVNGDFLIEVLASSVVYEDGSVWNVSQILSGEPTWQDAGKQRKQAVIVRPDKGTPDIVLNGTMVASYVKTTGALPNPKAVRIKIADFARSAVATSATPPPAHIVGSTHVRPAQTRDVEDKDVSSEAAS